MDYFLGTDLGSTTSKSIILDENAKMIGRGLTNTRSNYEVATKVAEQEAMIDARFTFLEEELRRELDLPDASIKQIKEQFELLFRYEHYFENLLVLKENIQDEARSFSQPLQDDLLAIINEIFGQVLGQSFAYFSQLGGDKSTFFRDLVGSQYMRLAEQVGTQFENLMSIFDKCILIVENQVDTWDVLNDAERALDKLMQDESLQSLKEPINTAFQRASRRPLNIVCKVGTGYGRLHLPYPKDQIQSEILCHGLGAHYMFPNTRTLLDIGGQDTKAIQVDDRGIVTSFFMNDRCAAGCGRFLGYIADELNLGLHELGPLSLQARKTVKISSTCTVFASIEIRDRLSLGERREDIVAGLHKAIVKRAMSLIARSGGVNNEFTFTGGVARNQAVVKYVREMVAEAYGDITINVSADSIFTGAVGGAMFARRKMGHI